MQSKPRPTTESVTIKRLKNRKCTRMDKRYYRETYKISLPSWTALKLTDKKIQI